MKADKLKATRPVKAADPVKRKRRWLATTLLLIVSVLICLILAEVGLRLFYPKYQYAAESDYQPNQDRIWARKPLTSCVRHHPDTGAKHLVAYNNLALRQHRNFELQDLGGAFNVAYFGDSYVENLRLPSQFASNEILDYLLNTTRGRANTLNFGVDGYGTAQQLIYYNSLAPELKRELDWVLYVHCGNDLRNLYENQLASLDGNGELVFAAAEEASWLTRKLSRLHLTYLVLDVLNRIGISSLSPKAAKHANVEALIMAEQHRQQRKGRFHSPEADGIETKLFEGQLQEIDETWKLFTKILVTWKENVEGHGSRFAVVTLPDAQHGRLSKLFPSEVTVLNLYEKIRKDFPDYQYHSARFEKDGHWNERGNVMTAYYLYRFLERTEAWPLTTDEELCSGMQTYLQVFAGQQHMPEKWKTTISVAESLKAELNHKYREIDLRLIRRGKYPLK